MNNASFPTTPRTRPSPDPPHFASHGDQASDQLLVYDYAGEPTEFPVRQDVAVSPAGKAFRRVFVTGTLPGTIEWEAVERKVSRMRFFLEVILQSDDAAFLERDEVEDSLQEALAAAGIGEVTGAGSGLGVANLDVEVTDREAGLALVRRVLRDLEVPPSTMIYLIEGDATKGTDKVTPYPIYQVT